jgi:6-pyruvoyltetrahydropterin/6-carboxytetrahydropterin synthase
MKVAKEFRWEMGHRLPEHFGLCKNIHGHSYKLIVEFEGELDKQGMVIDFYDVEKIINPIIEKLDHAFMVNKNDEATTVENISKYLLLEIKKGSFPENVSSVKVRVYETTFDYSEESIELR